LVLDVQNMTEVVLRSPSPAAATAILVRGAAIYFAFGAVIPKRDRTIEGGRQVEQRNR
jgi:hypothetical protein